MFPKTAKEHGSLGLHNNVHPRAKNMETTRFIVVRDMRAAYHVLELDYVICHMVSRLTNLVMSWSQG